MKSSDHYLTLILKHLQGEITSEELARLQAWKRESPEHQEEFDQFVKVWRAGETDIGYDPDLEAGWSRFKKSIDKTGSSSDISMTQSGESPGRVISVSRSALFQVAASLVLLLGFIWVFRYWTDQGTMIEYTTAANETRELVLPDSSKVWLNELSTLSYQKEFMAYEREVSLQGEAFFEIKKTRGKRFTVLTQQRKIEVLGTSFNVKAYEDSEFAVQVVTGRVAVTPRQEENYVYLEPEESVSATEGTALEVEPIEDPNFQAWRTKELTFQSVELGRVLTRIEAYYKIEIEVSDQDLLDCTFTGQFENANLDEVIRVIQLSLDLKVDKEQNKIILSGQGCK